MCLLLYREYLLRVVVPNLGVENLLTEVGVEDRFTADTGVDDRFNDDTGVDDRFNDDTGVDGAFTAIGVEDCFTNEGVSTWTLCRPISSLKPSRLGTGLSVNSKPFEPCPAVPMYVN